VEHTELKQRRAWTKEEIREVIWCYMYCRQHFTKNYKRVYEIWRQCNTECRINGCQETNEPEKLYYETQKDNGNEVEEIRKELQESHLEEREKQLEH